MIDFVTYHDCSFFLGLHKMWKKVEPSRYIALTCSCKVLCEKQVMASDRPSWLYIPPRPRNSRPTTHNDWMIQMSRNSNGYVHFPMQIKITLEKSQNDQSVTFNVFSLSVKITLEGVRTVLTTTVYWLATAMCNFKVPSDWIPFVCKIKSLKDR